MKTDKKHAAWQFGLNAESRAKWYLICKGYRILAQRFKSPVGEIDIVARRGRTLCFIEVKGRTRVIQETPVSNKQKQRIGRASLSFLQTQNQLTDLNIRYDVILVQPKRWPIHITDAWRP